MQNCERWGLRPQAPVPPAAGYAPGCSRANLYCTSGRNNSKPSIPTTRI